MHYFVRKLLYSEIDGEEWLGFVLVVDLKEAFSFLV